VMAGWIWGGAVIVLIVMVGQVYLEAVSRR
jgi:hypothetical protein